MVLRRLFCYWRSAKSEIAFGAFLLIVAAGLELLQPWPVKWLVDYVFGSRLPPGWLKTLFPTFAQRNPAGGITSVCISILVLAVVYRVTLALGHFFLVRAG